MRRLSAVEAIIAGGAAAGACDITYAIVFSRVRSGVAPSRVLQSVASGVLGAAAYSGGWPTALLGLALHFVNALIIAAIFYVAARNIPALTTRAATWGLAYGLGVYWFMLLVVIPLSAVPPRPFPAPIVVITGIVVHMLGVGLPIALMAKNSLQGAIQR